MRSDLWVSAVTILVSGVTIGAVLAQGDGHAPVEATSMMGEPLERPPLPPEEQARREAQLEQARTAYEADPGDEDAIIWYGRRLGYLGRYNDAIAIFTTGIERHPDSYRLRRHRGHRYITVRKIPAAIKDLETAASLIADVPDSVEPDGMPNARGIPTSTSHTNIHYHHGLAEYVRGNYRRAAAAYARCLALAENDDMRCAASYWLYLSLRRAGDEQAAAAVLEPISADMNVIENHAYHQLLLLYKGVRTADDLLSAESGSLEDVTTAYGVGAWFLINGDTDRARRTFEDLLADGMWPAFGYLAAEAEIARITIQEQAERDAGR